MMVVLEISSTSRVQLIWWCTEDTGGLIPKVRLHVADSDIEDSHAKDLLISAIGLSVRVSIIALHFRFGVVLLLK